MNIKNWPLHYCLRHLFVIPTSVKLDRCRKFKYRPNKTEVKMIRSFQDFRQLLGAIEQEICCKTPNHISYNLINKISWALSTAQLVHHFIKSNSSTWIMIIDTRPSNRNSLLPRFHQVDSDLKGKTHEVINSMPFLGMHLGEIWVLDHVVRSISHFCLLGSLALFTLCKLDYKLW